MYKKHIIDIPAVSCSYFNNLSYSCLCTEALQCQIYCTKNSITFAWATETVYTCMRIRQRM